jgi:hypothetical protein
MRKPKSCKLANCFYKKFGQKHSYKGKDSRASNSIDVELMIGGNDGIYDQKFLQDLANLTSDNLDNIDLEEFRAFPKQKY